MRVRDNAATSLHGQRPSQSEPAGSPARGAWLSEIFVSYQGEGARAGQKHLFVRFAGCNIRCRYCDTPDSLVRTRACEITWPDDSTEQVRNPIAPAELASIVERFCAEDPSIAMLALTGGEPMLQHAFLGTWLETHPPARPCLLETNALVVAGLERVLRHVALVSADVKLPSNSGEPAFWEEHRRFLGCCRDVEVYVKMPVDAGTDPEDVRRGARLVADCAPGAMLFLQPITGAHDAGWRLSAHRLLELTAVASAEAPRTFIRPQLHKLVGMR